MEMKNVDSSTVAAIGYDPDTKTMHVEFKSGATHEYDEVGQTVFNEFAASDSLGRHFASNFRHWPKQRKISG